MKPKKTKKKKLKSLKKLKHELDAIFSKYIRLRDGGKCITCNIQRPLSEMQNGHYFPRNKLGTRFCEINCNTQCVACNVFKKGNLAIYSVRLVEKHGVGVLSELEKLSNASIKYSTSDYEEMIDKYKQKLSDLPAQNLEYEMFYKMDDLCTN